MKDDATALTGHCACGEATYRMTAKPMIVHCCHCTWCQRESGSAFAVNALIEADRVELLTDTLEILTVPTASGSGQVFHRCPSCRVTLWTNYSGMGDRIHFVRAGTLDDPSRVPPDIHIYTSTKQPWVALPDGVPAVDEYYRRSEIWPEQSIARYRALKERPA